MSSVVANGTYFGRALHVRQSVGLSLAETVYDGGVCVPAHAHETALCVLVLEGAFEEQAAHARDYCGPGALLVIPTGTTHAHRFLAPRSRAFTVQFGDEWTRRLADDDLCTPVAHRVLDPGAASWHAARLYREFRRAEPGSLALDEGAADMLLVLASRTPRVAAGDRRSAWMRTVRDYVHAHFREAFSLGDVARLAGVNPSYLSRAFRRHSGETLSGFVRRLRLEHATLRLARENAPIGAIALDAGFADHAHFTREFRRVAGTTPQAYRALFSPPRAGRGLPSAPSL
jgi:AraC-like DNA-binding protein/quercetin dioxygenase-like cupin family protein